MKRSASGRQSNSNLVRQSPAENGGGEQKKWKLEKDRAAAAENGNPSGQQPGGMQGMPMGIVPGRFNEALRGVPARGAHAPGAAAANAQLAFGQKPPTPSRPGKNGRNKPPLKPKAAQGVDGFDKKEWIREYRLLKKDTTLEDRDRFRPLLCLKRDFQELILECEKIEKKDLINLHRDQDQQMQFLQRQKQDIKQVRIMIEKSKTSSDAQVVDRIHAKVQTVEQNIKNMKLKSRQVYEQLADEENQLDAELTALADKYESWEQQGPEFMNEYQNYKIGAGSKQRKDGNVKGLPARRRAGSVAASSRLLGQKKEGRKQQDQQRQDGGDSDDEDGGDEEVDEAEQIKMEIEQIEDKIQRLGGVQSCGWDPADHKDFLRVRTKHKERVKTVAFLTEMKRAVPTADEESIQTHIEVFQKVQELLEKKKGLMKQYKEVRKQSDSMKSASRVDSQNNLFSKLNNDLQLIIGDGQPPAQGRSARAVSAAERSKRKEELEKWKKEKTVQRQAELIQQNEEQLRIRRSLQRQKEGRRREQKEQVEEYRFRKEMEKQTEKMLDNMEKNKVKEVQTAKDQMERIKRREEEMVMKQQAAVQNKLKEQFDRQSKVEALTGPSKQAEKLKDKVQSKLLVETKAMQDKKREKYDPSKDGPGRDAMTMGGNLLGLPLRNQAGWRAGL